MTDAPNCYMGETLTSVSWNFVCSRVFTDCYWTRNLTNIGCQNFVKIAYSLAIKNSSQQLRAFSTQLASLYNIHTYIHTYTYIHTFIHSYILTYKHTHTSYISVWKCQAASSKKRERSAILPKSTVVPSPNFNKQSHGGGVLWGLTKLTITENKYVECSWTLRSLSVWLWRYYQTHFKSSGFYSYRHVRHGKIFPTTCCCVVQYKFPM